MDIIYYPDMLLQSEVTLKELILFWGSVKTIVPRPYFEIVKNYFLNNSTSTIKEFLTEYFEPISISSEKVDQFDSRPRTVYHLSIYGGDEVEIYTDWENTVENYKRIVDLAGEPILDFIVVTEEEKTRAHDSLIDLIANWYRDRDLISELRLDKSRIKVGSGFWEYANLNELNWIHQEDLIKFTESCGDETLLDLLWEETLIIERNRKVFCTPKFYSAYRSILAEIIKQSREIRIITNDEFSLVAKSGIGITKDLNIEPEEEYQLISLAIPKIYIKSETIKKMPWKSIIKIRKDLIPLAADYYRELEKYQKSINSLSEEGNDQESFELFCEFCARVSISFKPFAKEVKKIFNLATETQNLVLLNGIILPFLKLINPDPELSKVCDISAITSTSINYMLSGKKNIVGFDYLENLSRKLNVERLKNNIIWLVPKEFAHRLQI